MCTGFKPSTLYPASMSRIEYFLDPASSKCGYLLLAFLLRLVQSKEGMYPHPIRAKLPGLLLSRQYLKRLRSAGRQAQIIKASISTRV